jgi:ribosomal protein S18 acetylase RimI-like enzyme
MTTTIEPVGPAHPRFDPVAALFDEYRVHYGLPSAPAETRAFLAARPFTVTASLHDGEPRGVVTVLTMPASLRLGVVWSIRDLYVPARHRRQGIARALLGHVIQEAREAGALRVSLQTETDNAPALALYRDLGFTPVTGLELLNRPIR